ncbi:hypothetical protein C8R45DRAFT_931866 [Mycena sanguinolenta]|nr:hypothetical protein C8R45DRAFT_931866 [Mycena sanguinolenta]
MVCFVLSDRHQDPCGIGSASATASAIHCLRLRQPPSLQLSPLQLSTYLLPYFKQMMSGKGWDNSSFAISPRITLLLTIYRHRISLDGTIFIVSTVRHPTLVRRNIVEAEQIQGFEDGTMAPYPRTHSGVLPSTLNLITFLLYESKCKPDLRGFDNSKLVVEAAVEAPTTLISPVSIVSGPLVSGNESEEGCSNALSEFKNFRQQRRWSIALKNNVRER